MTAFRFKRNDDGTVTIKEGRKVCHIDLRGKSREEAADALRWGAMGVGIVVNRELADIILRTRS